MVFHSDSYHCHLRIPAMMPASVDLQSFFCLPTHEMWWGWFCFLCTHGVALAIYCFLVCIAPSSGSSRLTLPRVYLFCICEFCAVRTFPPYWYIIHSVSLMLSLYHGVYVFYTKELHDVYLFYIEILILTITAGVAITLQMNHITSTEFLIRYTVPICLLALTGYLRGWKYQAVILRDQKEKLHAKLLRDKAQRDALAAEVKEMERLLVESQQARDDDAARLRDARRRQNQRP